MSTTTYTATTLPQLHHYYYDVTAISPPLPTPVLLVLLQSHVDAKPMILLRQERLGLYSRTKIDMAYGARTTIRELGAQGVILDKETDCTGRHAKRRTLGTQGVTLDTDRLPDLDNRREVSGSELCYHPEILD